MSVDKKSFLLYCDLIHTISKMPNDKAGELFKHILEYVNDKDPVTEDLIIQLTFEPIKQSLKRDLEKYERIRLKNVDNANKRWNKDNATASDRIPNDTKNADSGIVSVSVSDSVNGIDKIILNDNLEEIQIQETLQVSNVPVISKSDNFIKFETWILENAPQVAKMKEPFTEAQFLKLGKDFSREQIIETISAMHNKKDLLKKYNSANLTLRSWINLKNQKNEQSTTIGRTAKPNPTDAYDEFGKTIRGLANMD
jgi:hypothetical protein